jgi:hypothetical protein
MMTTDKTKTMKRLTRVVTFVMFDNTIASLVKEDTTEEFTIE